ncbi:MAG: CHASE domain-containing protein [Candidatus Competibacteraceae bacterium]|nr:MAG: CHASE domain-containing protein [Candidatus Competibacteraceae bacterium]
MDQVAHDIENRLESQARIPRSAASLFAASKTVARQELHGHVEALRLPENHPGIQGIGLVGRIPPGQKTAHIAAVRQEGFPGPAAHPPPEGANSMLRSSISNLSCRGRSMIAGAGGY